GKTLILRGFYSGQRLHYDAAGTLIGSAGPGDWMNDGFVQVKEIRSAHRHLLVEAERELVIQFEGKEFAFLREKADAIDKQPLSIEADIDLGQILPDQADAVMAKIFLTANDDLSAIVSAYWEPCLRAAASGSSDFSMSSDLRAVAGVTPSAAAGPASAESGGEHALDCKTQIQTRRGVHPTITYQREPDFSDRARSKRRQGDVILLLVVNPEGLPENIRIIRPLGYGLDEKALSCIRMWKFQAAQVDDRPVAWPISVQLNFHSY
ncbi:MAG: energy transducer TonB, partial [Candidatus Sulfotelmatobacter sp.]